MPRSLLVRILLGVLLTACTDSAAPPSNPRRILTFAVQPPRTAPHVVLAPAPQVEVRFLSGERDTASSVDISLVLGPGAPSAELLGTRTVRAVAGLAAFNDLEIDTSSTVALYASAPGGLQGSSRLFRVVVPFTSLSSGVNHSCAITMNGQAYCWGENSSGQLGVGSTSLILTPRPVMTPSGITFSAIGVGHLHACALTNLGALYCWGVNNGSSLGDGSAESRTAPVPVHTPTGVTFTFLNVGYYHSCAIATGGTTYCWGVNFYGELGDGTGQTPSEPVAVAAPGGVSFTQVSAGLWHTCGVTAQGAAYCWGANDYGALGDGTADSSWTPVPVSAPAGVTFTVVSAGAMHSCGLTPTGAAYCWGRNDGGQLGDGTTTSRSTPVAVQGTAGIHFAAITAGQLRTCAVSESGAAYCWGSTPPAPIPVPDAQHIVDVSVSLGDEACMLSNIGLAYCWGNNNFGQVGDSTQIPRPTPVAVIH